LLLSDIQWCVAEAEAQGVPLFVGEFGVGSAVANAQAWMRDEFQFQDQYLLSSAWWSMRQHDNNTHGLTEFDTRAEKRVLLDYVARPYPMATAGDLLAFAYDETTKTFTMTFANNDTATGETWIAVPQYQYENGIEIRCSDPQGSWGYVYDPANSLLRLSVDPLQPQHTITIFPKT
jgi:hypothetical protein